MTEEFTVGALGAALGCVAYVVRAVHQIPSPTLPDDEFWRRLVAHEQSYTAGRMVTAGIVTGVVAVVVFRWAALL